MAKDKRSFFEKLTGASSEEGEEMEYGDAEDERDEEVGEAEDIIDRSQSNPVETSGSPQEPVESEAQLPIDMYQTPEEIAIKAVIGGVKPEDLDISITRDTVTLKGKREESQRINEENYFYQELFWGSFSRTIILPQEIEVEEAEARESEGLLFIRLPKVNKDKQTKLKVKSN